MRTNRMTLAALVAASTAALVLSGCSSADESVELSDGPTGVAESPAATDASTNDDAADESETPDGVDERDVRGQTPEIDYEQAVSLAVDAAGGGFVYQIELDHSRDAGEWVYEIDVLNGGTSHELKLSASSGDVLEHERDDEDDDEREVSFDDMTPEEALQIATDEIGSDEVIEGWTFSWDDGRLQYDIDLLGDDDLEINVEDGSVSRD